MTSFSGLHRPGGGTAGAPRPAAEERIPSAADYFALLERPGVVDQSAQRRPSAVVKPALTSVRKPGRAVRTMAEETLAALGAVTDDPVIDTTPGGIRLNSLRAHPHLRAGRRSAERLLSGRHSDHEQPRCRRGDRSGVTFPPKVLSEVLHLANDIALVRGDGETLLPALTGRRPLPDRYSLV